MKTRHILSRALLALVLLLSQQMAFAHAVSHLSGTHQDSSGKPLKADQFCGECLAAAQLDGSAPASAVTPVFASAPAGAVAPLPETLLLPSRTASFQPRAPPAA